MATLQTYTRAQADEVIRPTKFYLHTISITGSATTQVLRFSAIANPSYSTGTGATVTLYYVNTHPEQFNINDILWASDNNARIVSLWFISLNSTSANYQILYGTSNRPFCIWSSQFTNSTVTDTVTEI